MEFTLRAAGAADYQWLWELKRLTMRAYVEQTWGSWDEPAQEAFFRRNFSPATIQVVVVGGRSAGLLEVAREPKDLFLANVQIDPDFQNRGLGTAVVQTVLATGEALGLPVRLQVLRVNGGARRLYERLGFAVYEETATHALMRWHPPE
jgi:ribosomal protein S18 acetylase RimI-like enzyme